MYVSMVFLSRRSHVLSIGYKARSDPNAPGNLIVLTGEAHAKRRKLWNRGMSSDSIKNYEAIIAKRASQLAEEVGEAARDGSAVDLASWISFFTYAFFLSTACFERHRMFARRFDFMGDMA